MNHLSPKVKECIHMHTRFTKGSTTHKHPLALIGMLGLDESRHEDPAEFLFRIFAELPTVERHFEFIRETIVANTTHNTVLHSEANMECLLVLTAQCGSIQKGLDRLQDWRDVQHSDSNVRGFNGAQERERITNPPQELLVQIQRGIDGVHVKDDTFTHIDPRIQVVGVNYTIAAVVYQTGSLTHGHYITIFEINGQW